MKFLLIIISLLVIFCSCTNSKKNETEKEFDSGAIFYNYKVWGEEGSDSVTILLQYRGGNDESSAMFLDSGSKVTLDGKEIEADSARLTGVYYEAVLPAGEFRGQHTIVFTDRVGKEHRQEFSFFPFSLAADLPERIKKEPFTIRLKGLDKGPVRVQFVMIDTAFNTPDVNEDVVIKNGELAITAKMLRALKAGPVTLEIYLEEETVFEKSLKEDGKLLMTYKLKREFEAVDN
jgi:hypothetical protein